MARYRPHIDELPTQAADYSPPTQEQKRLHRTDLVVLEQALHWLKNFWWENRAENCRTELQAAWETDRAVKALIDLKNSPCKKKSGDTT